jgi:pimeloyl-ACP methyl ester carboxylesterase
MNYLKRFIKYRGNKKVALKIPYSILLLLITIRLSAQDTNRYNMKTSKMKTMFKNIEFQSEGATLRGRLYSPDSESKNLPVIIMAHGYSATIEGMVADRYAEVFCNAGFAVLLYDHRNFGISDGEPRQQINKWTQARGFRDAINFVITLSEIDSTKIGLWGDSMSGDVVILVAAMDHRVKTVVVQVPACGSELPPPDLDGSLFKSLINTFLHGDIEGTPETTLGPMPVVSFDQGSIPSMLKPLTAYRWFIEYGCRYNTKWLNNVTYVTPKVPTKFNSVLCISHLRAAILMMVAYKDEMEGANSDVARYAYKLAPEPKKLVEIGGHFGLLFYPSKLFDEASSTQANFFIHHLK